MRLFPIAAISLIVEVMGRPLVGKETIVNFTLTADEAQEMLDDALTSEYLCDQHLEVVNSSYAEFVSLAECYAKGRVKGVPANADFALAFCTRAAEERKVEFLRLDREAAGGLSTGNPSIAVSCHAFFSHDAGTVLTVAEHAAHSVPPFSQSKAELRKLREASALWRTGISELAAALAAHPADPSVAVLAAEQLAEMKSARAVAAIAESEELPLLARAMYNLRSNGDVIRQTSTHLADIVAIAAKAGNTGVLRAMVDAGIVDALVAGLASHTATRITVLAIVKALIYLSAGEQTAAVLAAGATGPLADALPAYASDPAAFIALCKILAISLDTDRVDICTAFMSLTAVEPLVAALEARKNDAAIVTEAGGVLAIVAHHALGISEIAPPSFLTAIAPLQAALSKHAAHTLAAGAVGLAFKNLAVFPELIEPMVDAGAPRALVAALVKQAALPRPPAQSSEVHTLNYICGALVNLAISGPGAAPLVDAGAIPALARVLTAQYADPYIAEPACGALSNLARNASYLVPMVEAGLVRPLVAALKACVSNSGVVVSASHSLGALFDVPRGRAEAEEAGVMAALRRAETYHGPRTAAGSTAKSIKDELLAHRAEALAG
jgi:hypothetical protein